MVPDPLRYDPPNLIGAKLLHYEITAQLGEGGMGVVYQATDTRLNREVAIKVLPDAFVEDSERLARFEREAQLLAALNHPNIGGIYGLEESGATKFLVLELIPGDALSERLRRGAIPVAEALPVALQITQALEAAHAQGIVHRDLKPDNIKITPQGQVKVLDFGLAKAWDQPADAGFTHSPTLTAQMTQAGVILGTASYMSPEQARGQEVDKRADIWSFGVVLFEILTGGRLFSGKTVTDVLAAIVHKEPDWERLPPDLPRSIERLLKRCLDKDAQHRVQDIGDARIELEDTLERGDEAPVLATPARTPVAIRRAPWAIAAAAVLVSVWALMGSGGAPPIRLPYARYTLTTPEGPGLFPEMGQVVAISPDGSQVVYIIWGEDDTVPYLRSRGETEAQAIPGAEGAEAVAFSPDGRSIVFHRATSILKLALQGGTVRRLAPQLEVLGLDWTDRGEIVYSASWSEGIRRVSAEGGESTVVTKPDAEAGEGAHLRPAALPGGEAVLFSIWNSQTGAVSIAVASLATGEHEVLLQDATMPRYSPTGHLLFVRGETLMAVAFDAERLEISGEPVAIETGVRSYPQSLTAIYDISDEGTLVFQEGGTWQTARELVWVSPEGEATLAVEDQRSFTDPRISPDGRQLSVTVEGSLNEIWIYDLATGTRSQLTRVSDNGGAEWLPEGREIVFWSALPPPSSISRMPVSGSSRPEVIYLSEGEPGQPTLSPDGSVMIFEDSLPGRTADLMLAYLDGREEARPFKASDADEGNPAFSPDGRWVAYTSSESGRDEIYVAPFPGPGPSWLISSGGGTVARWSLDGSRLFYKWGPQLFAVDVETGQDFQAHRPTLLFETPDLHLAFDVARDRDGFLMMRRVANDSPTDRRIEVALNWPQLLDQDD